MAGFGPSADFFGHHHLFLNIACEEKDMDKKGETEQKPGPPLIMKNGIQLQVLQVPQALATGPEYGICHIRTGPCPEAVGRLLAGRNESAKSFMEADLERLRSSTRIERIRPALNMLGNSSMAEAKPDFRTGKMDIRSTLPKAGIMEDQRIPMHPEIALSGAMKKLGHSNIR